MRVQIKIILFSGLAFFSGCSNEDLLYDESEECGVLVDFDGSTISFCNSQNEELDRVQDEFIWQAMNYYYFWQDEVSNLSDDKFEDFSDLYHFLNESPSSESLFMDELLSPNDRFSWIVDDYIALENAFQGISTSFGYEFGLIKESGVTDEIFGYVRYVITGGPADLAGLERGMLFSEVNGVRLTEGNFENALFENSSYTLTIAELQDDMIASTSQTVELTAVVLEENPILTNKVLDLSGGNKVGYLAYNQFVFSNEAHRQLNDVFGQFLSAGITDLVLDLRYNPGGSLTTAQILSSMIYGSATETDQIGSIEFNEKLALHFESPFSFTESLPIFDENDLIAGEETLNRLTNLNRVFILTTSNTVSASELLIVGLDPYMDVTTIGTTTRGKNEVSLTLYDSKNSLFRDRDSDDLNQNHTYAIQPIIGKLSNSEGFTDYDDGLIPDVEIDETQFLEDLKPLGDEDEPLLAEALAIISGNARRTKKDNGIGVHFDYINKKKERLEKTILAHHNIL